MSKMSSSDKLDTTLSKFVQFVRALHPARDRTIWNVRNVRAPMSDWSLHHNSGACGRPQRIDGRTGSEEDDGSPRRHDPEVAREGREDPRVVRGVCVGTRSWRGAGVFAATRSATGPSHQWQHSGWQCQIVPWQGTGLPEVPPSPFTGPLLQAGKPRSGSVLAAPMLLVAAAAARGHGPGA